ncbi:TIGR02530 family flagellar biosynthesis protein [Marasmitruncus massiliensis]|jgi:flagellar operon protein|uniref:TIGR02530 family flagellar biosynthesis protein n=1 Tax=Marasmitruncus massiliensis TaxID=1944642 RepID=UPI000C7DE3E4|nr:TIGR02530 family flagellar biosynthesis protein [Marasmitruncus massiliensis]MBE6906532.1 flagellar protein [Oscillospiraceae bacterium]
MSPVDFNRFSVPIVTGTPRPIVGNQEQQQNTVSGANSFQEIFQRELDTNKEVTFSKHAAQRVAQRQVDLSEDSIERLNQGVQLAKEKGLNETLILVDKTAFIVNVKNNMVVTTVNSGESVGNVFTNIDGTVII